MTTPRRESGDENQSWEHLVLPLHVKEQLQSAWRAIRDMSSRGDTTARGVNILVFGPPGTGKTEITKAFENIGGVRFSRAWAGDFRAPSPGQSAQRIREIFSRARGSAPAVLCIDLEQGPYSDYCVFPRRGSPGWDDRTEELISETLAQMDNVRGEPGPVSVLGQAFQADEVEPSILRRFDIRIEIPLPGEAERREILERKISALSVPPAFDVEEMSTLLARRLDGRSGRDLESLVRSAAQRAARRAYEAGTPETIVVTREDLRSP